MPLSAELRDSLTCCECLVSEGKFGMVTPVAGRLVGVLFALLALAAPEPALASEQPASAVTTDRPRVVPFSDDVRNGPLWSALLALTSGLGGAALVMLVRLVRNRTPTSPVTEPSAVVGHLQTLLANLPGVVYRMRLTPTNSELTYLGEAFERQYGLSAERYQNMTLAERLGMIHPDDHASHAERWHTLSTKGEMVARTRFLRPDGQIRWFEYHERVVDRYDDELITEGLVLDVTAEEAARQMLKTTSEQQRILAAIVDAMPDLAWAKDRNGSYLTVNAALAQYISAAAASVMHAGPCREVLPSDLMDMFALRHEAVMRENRVDVHEERVPGADGSIRWFDVRRAPLRDASGAVTGTVGVARDITERKQLEEELRETADALQNVMVNLPCAIYRGVDRDGGGITMTHVSDGVFAMTGYKPDEWIAMVNQGPYGFGGVHPDDRAAILAASQERRTTGLFSVTIRQIRKDGHSFWAALRSRRMTKADGSAVIVGLILDINREMETRLALEAQRQRFEDLVSVLPVGVFEDKPGVGNIYVNQRWADFVGLRRDELTGPNWSRGIHVDDLERVGADWADAVARRAEVSNDCRLVTPDGKVTWVHVHAVPRFAADGTFLGHVGTASDITRLREMERELRDTAKRLQVLLENLPGAVYWGVERPQGLRLTYISEGVTRITGFTADEWIARSHDGRNPIHPEDQAILAKGGEQRRRSGGFAATLRMPRKDGGWFWAMLRSRIMDHDSDTPIVAGLMLDVSGEMEAKLALDAERQRFEALVDNLPGGVIRAFLDWQGNLQVRYMSRGMCQMAAVDMAVEQPLALIHPDDRHLIAEAVPQLAATGRTRSRVRTLRPDGGIVWQDVWSTVVEHCDDGMIVESLILDVTEEVEAKTALEAQEAEQRRLQNQIHEARKLESLGKLAGGIAHDFNNLLGAILGFGQFIIEDAAADHPAFKHAQRILSAAQRGKVLVDQILAFARPTRTETACFPLGALVAECGPLLHVAIPSTIRIDMQLENPPPEVEADRGQLERVLMNLCFNARDALAGQPGTITVGARTLAPRHPLLMRAGAAPSEGAAAITVSTESDGTVCAVAGHCDSDRSHALLWVSDTGTGMDSALLSKAFDPFFTTKEPGKGTGLGLSVVHGIVMAHGGAVAVRSRATIGSEFSIILPLAKASQRVASAVTDVSAPAFPVQGRGAVLVVDDNEDLGDMLGEFLRRQGWTVSQHTNPLAALEAFAVKPEAWTLVITDQIMPELRGDDLIARIKARRADLPCILCTGYGGLLDDDRAARQGIDALMRKPVEMDALTTTIAMVTSKKRQTEGSPHDLYKTARSADDWK